MAVKHRIGMALALALALVLAGPAFPLHAAEGTGTPGFRTLAAPVPARGHSIDVTVWYPAGDGGEEVRFGASPVFTGEPGRRGAAVAEGAFPTVLIAHGGLRANAGAAGWIAAALARRGYVVAIAHPPPLKPDEARRAVAEVWLRPADLSAALDAVQADPALSAHTAPGKVAALGFFLGGTSVLALAGGRLDGALFRQSCDPPRIGPDCRWFSRFGVNLHDAAAGPAVEAGHRDPRVTLALAVNPELTDSMVGTSLSPPAVPVRLLHTGPAGGLKTLIPGVVPEALAAASPFSLFGDCTPKAPAILEEEGEDPGLCRDGKGRTRAEIHALSAARIAALLEQGLR